MTRIELPAQAANLQRSVGSTSTCTLATVESLKALLLPESLYGIYSKKASAKKGQSLHSRSLKPGPARSRERNPFTICEDPSSKHKAIKAEEKLTLATSIVNDTLKALTAAAKAKIYRSPSHPKRASLTRCSSGCSSLDPATARCSSPLQQISTNRSMTPSKRGPKGQPPTDGDGEIDGLKAQAHCARIGLACLRVLQGQERKVNLPYLQLEMGMSALIHKLIALGFFDLAVKELRILRKRLISLHREKSGLGNNRDCNSQQADKGSDSNPQKQSTVELLSFGDLVDRGPLLSLVTTTQLQLLRILATTGVSDTEELWNELRLDNPGCPTTLIENQFDPEQKQTKEKVVLQLESLAQVLLKICDIASGVSLAKRDVLQAEHIFKLRILALQTKARWWDLSQHSIDLSKDLITPFAQYLNGYRQYSGANKEDQYNLAKKAFDAFTAIPRANIIRHDQLVTPLYRVMAELAGAAGQSNDETLWFEKAISSVDDSKPSHIQKGIIACQLVTTQLRRGSDQQHDEAIISLLKNVAECLNGELHGEYAELDELLVVVSSLRKSASVVVLKSKHNKPDSASQPFSGPVKECLQLLASIMRFIVRYLGNDPGHGANDGKLARYKHRTILVAAIMPSTIEVFSTLGRLYARSPPEEWGLINAALQDCIRLATCLEDSYVAKKHIQIMKVSPFALISGSYWCRYLDLRRVSADFGEQERCLRASLDLIKHRERDVQTDGSLLLKLEHYGVLHESGRDLRRALDIYVDSLQAHIDLGIVSKAAETALASSLAIVFDHDEEVRLLARTLLAHLRVASKLNESGTKLSLYFDRPELPVNQRIILLEYQYTAMVSKLDSRGKPSAYYHSIREMTNTLLALSSSDEFSVRRLQLAVQMLYLRMTHPAAFEESLLSPMVDQYSNQSLRPTSKSNQGLEMYTPQLLSSLSLLVTMRKHNPDLDAVSVTLESWLELLDDCPDLKSLQTQVYDITSWILQLEMILEYLDAQGLDYLKTLALQVAIKVCEPSSLYDASDIASKWTDLGAQYTRLGYSGYASANLQKAQRYLQSANASSTSVASLTWLLARANLDLETQNYIACNDHIQTLRQQVWKEIDSNEERQFYSKRIQVQHLAADTDMLQSRLAAAEGRSYEALLLARLGVKSYYQIWGAIERRQRTAGATPTNSADENVNETVINKLSEPSFSKQHLKPETSKYALLQCAAFWKVVPRLFSALLQLSCLFAHNGLYTEASYYLTQSGKIAGAVCASNWLSKYWIVEAQYASRSGNDSGALDILQRAQAIVGNASNDRLSAMLQARLAVCLARNGQREAGDIAANMTKSMLQRLKSRQYVDALVHRKSAMGELNTLVSKLVLDKAESAPRSGPRTRVAVSKERAKESAAMNVTQPPFDMPVADVLGLWQMEAAACRERADAALSKGDLELASVKLDETDGVPCSRQDLVLRAISTAELSLGRGLQSLAKDPIFSIVSESAISHPSASDHRQCTDTKAIKIDASRTSESLRKPMAKSIVQKPKQDVAVEQKGYVRSLQAAQRIIKEVFRQALLLAATNSLYHAMDVLSRITMMLCTLSLPGTQNPDSPTFIVYIIELSRMVSMFRESLAILVEKRVLEEVKDRQMLLADDAHELSSLGSLDLPRFQALYIDIIPDTWDVVSITLSDSEEELIMTRIRSNQAPFVLRIPFKRQNATDCDEESFGFQEARKELRDIVDLANRSSQDAGDLSRKGAKTQWWNVRSALDARLKDLLNNIESIWLGGFRGILSHSPAKSVLLARFQKSLENALDKHLPSRQKPGKRKQAGRIMLDSQVLELFIGLGCPTDTNDVDEALVDLLYFVIDILQFNGERNAYDEIDFDSLVIEILDALRHYHQVAQNEGFSEERQHTILILDKHLHCIPWESLPCLRGRSVSRMPSLACLRMRILQQREQKSRGPSLPAGEDVLRVTQQNGAFVLNPAGDLNNTQKKFEGLMQNLPCWEGIIQREPEEAEMKDYLENHGIFLYFGHGSGGQYIRSKTIKKLGKCAVALLMGCSSGALAEAGDFEPYGTPINYMHAGCPALLATLWDVTDKDIDRFSQTALEKWGLFNDQQPSMFSNPIKKSVKQRGKGRGKERPKAEDEAKRPVSLNEAVAQARDSCIMKYLNGAAPDPWKMPVTTKASIASFGGKLLKLAHNASTTSCEMHFNLYLPPQATLTSQASHRVPLLIYLAGLTCTGDNGAEKGFFQHKASQKGIAILYPDTSPRRNDTIAGEADSYDFGTGAGFYLDATKEPWSQAGYRMYSYITDELPRTVFEAFEQEIDSSRVSIFGHSMGGHGALTLFLKNPGKYKSVSAFAPIANPMRCPWGEKAFKGYFGEEDTARWAEHDATELVKGWEGQPLDILIDVGTADNFYKQGQLLPENFVKAAEGKGKVNLRWQDGYDHSYFTMASFADDHVEHAADALLK
ncbi:MAG: hypothetical protein Q9163_001398 [Psora crenata]